MLFEYQLTVTAGTLASAPVELDAPLAHGVVRQVGIQFPAGTKTHVMVSIWRAGHQVWPADLDGSISADGHVVQWPEDYDLTDLPWGFVLKGWAPLARYTHVITFRFAVLDYETAAAERATPGLLRRVIEFLGMRG